MLKIIIADDEIHIRELIVKCINQSDLGFEVVGEAEHGREAFELIEKQKPDILITDVCMPGTSGLELIERIKNDPCYHELKTIIISGYDEFLYVQKALKLGVSNYLLKPFSPEELLENLEDMQQEIERTSAVRHNLSTLEAQFKNQLTLLQENILKQLISTESNQDELVKKGASLGMRLDFPQYYAGIIKLCSDKRGSLLGAEEKAALEEIILSVKERYFDESITPYGIRLDDNVMFILFGSAGKQKSIGIQHIKKGILKLNDSLKRYYRVSLNCALGNVRNELKDIRLSYEEARYVMRTNSWESQLFAEYSGIKYKEAEGKGQPEYLREQGGELILQIKMANREKAISMFHNMMEGYDGVDVGSMENIDIFLLELLFKLENILRSAGLSDEMLGKMRLHECVKQRILYGDMWEIKKFMEEIIIKSCVSFEKLNQSKGDKIVQQIKCLMEHNLSKEELDLESVASQLFFSSNYLRRIFKQVEGISFSDYLIRRRMETAREKLKDSSKKIIDISEECGYSNQRYFASAFKKYYGVTPTEYREKMEGEEKNE